MQEVLSSGATVDVTIAPVKLGFQLLGAIVRQFKNNGLDLDITANTELSIAGLLGSNPQKFVSGALDVITSELVLEIVLRCAATAIYKRNGVSQKVTLELFDDEENRRDFFEVMKIIAWKNLEPFFPKARIKSKQTAE